MCETGNKILMMQRRISGQLLHFPLLTLTNSWIFLVFGRVCAYNITHIPTASVPDPGSGALLTRDPGWVINQDPDSGSGSGMNIPDHISESLETIFWVKILKFVDPDRGSRIFLTRSPGWENFGSGINSPDPQHSYNFTSIPTTCITQNN
jgi:hypothetical protein